MSQPTSPGPVPASARVLHVLLGLGVAVTGLGIDHRTVNAADADAPTVEHAWCVEVTGSAASPDCTYSDFLVCTVAALRSDGSCKPRSSMQADAADPRPTRSSAPPRRSVNPTAIHPKRDSPLSPADREKLFRRFVEWTQGRSNQ